MKKQSFLFITILSAGLILIGSIGKAQQLPHEQLLWPDGIPNNPIVYDKEKMRGNDYLPSSLSQMNRVFSNVSTPTYIIHQPKKENSIGVGLVICPGGGFRDVWFDREGNDFALWLTQYGITSLVLKYRTYNENEGVSNLDREQYNPHVYADAKQAINILRSNADEFGLDKNKIGIGGFSAGGALSLFASLEIYEAKLPDYAQFNKNNTKPDFTCLIYPGIRDIFFEKINEMDSIPPMFIINGAPDNVTPALKALKLYNALINRQVPAELHVYSIGNHGFDSGIGRGYGISMWRDSFIAWLKDMEIME